MNENVEQLNRHEDYHYHQRDFDGMQEHSEDKMWRFRLLGFWGRHCVLKRASIDRYGTRQWACISPDQKQIEKVLFTIATVTRKFETDRFVSVWRLTFGSWMLWIGRPDENTNAKTLEGVNNLVKHYSTHSYVQEVDVGKLVIRYRPNHKKVVPILEEFIKRQLPASVSYTLLPDIKWYTPLKKKRGFKYI